MVENFIRKTPSLHYLTFGDYGDPPSLVRWTAQLGIWLTLVITGKVVCVSILLEFSTALENAISFIFQDLKAHPQSELIVVMIIIPGILNVVSFWITDTFLKENGASHEQIPLTDLDEDLLEMGTVNEGELVLISNGSVRARPIAVPQKRIPSSTTSLASPADASPSSTQSIWQSASSAIPDILTSLSSRVSGPSNGINLTSSLEHVTEDEDDL